MSQESRVLRLGPRAGQITGFLPRLLRHAVEKLPRFFRKENLSGEGTQATFGIST